MGLKQTFQSAVATAFKVFGDIVKTAIYIESNNDGFGVVTEVEHPTKVILAALEEKEINQLSFRDKIQSTDAIGLIEANSIPVKLATHNSLKLSDRTFKIIAFDLDPAEALYITLLRA